MPVMCCPATTGIFLPTKGFNGLFAGECQLTQDSCNGQGPDECASVDYCAVVHSCETSRCDPNDQCCSLDPLSCYFNPSCDPTGFECLPAYNDCAVSTDATSCAMRNYCGWNAATSTCNIVDLGRHPCRSPEAMGSMDACMVVPDSTFGAPGASGDGAYMCQVQSTCKSVCSSCQDAVQHLLDATAPLDNQTDAATLADGFLTVCMNELIPRGLAEDYQCGDIWLSIFLSPNGWYLKRPAAIAQALELCPTVDSGVECTITINAPDGRVVGPGPTSTCTREGVDDITATWVGDNKDAAIGLPDMLPPGYCRMDIECQNASTPTNVCAPYGGPLPEVLDCYCNLDDGSDDCYSAGQCMDFCDSPVTKDALDEANWRINNTLAGICTSDAGCMAGHVCNTTLPAE